MKPTIIFIPPVTSATTATTGLKQFNASMLFVAATFEQRLEGGDFLELNHIRVIVDVSHGLGPWSHHHNIIHLGLLAGRRWHYCKG